MVYEKCGNAGYFHWSHMEVWLALFGFKILNKNDIKLKKKILPEKNAWLFKIRNGPHKNRILSRYPIIHTYSLTKQVWKINIFVGLNICYVKISEKKFREVYTR